MYIVYFKKPSSVELAFLVESINLDSYLNLGVQKRYNNISVWIDRCTVT